MIKTPNVTISADQFTKALLQSLKQQAKELDDSLKFPEGTPADVQFARQHSYNRQRAEIENASRAVEPFLRALGSARFAAVEVA